MLVRIFVSHAGFIVSESLCSTVLCRQVLSAFTLVYTALPDAHGCCVGLFAVVAGET